MTALEREFFAEIKRRYGVTKLALVGDEDEKPADPLVKNLATASADFDRNLRQARGGKLKSGVVYWRTGAGEDDFKPVKLWVEISR